MEKCSCIKEDIEKINMIRVIDKLDFYLARNEYDAALKHLLYFKNEAIRNNDTKSLLSILSELAGLTRKMNNATLGLEVCNEAIELIKQENIEEYKSVSTIIVNLATALSSFGKYNEAISLYDKAIKNMDELTYEYASLLNNKATTLSNLNNFKEAKDCLEQAINILKKLGNHDGEIAISYLNLAHLTYDFDNNAYQEVEKLLDESWLYLNSNTIVRDSNYAYILSKCAPSYQYFKREVEAKAASEVSKEIYEAYKCKD